MTTIFSSCTGDNERRHNPQICGMHDLKLLCGDSGRYLFLCLLCFICSSSESDVDEDDFHVGVSCGKPTFRMRAPGSSTEEEADSNSDGESDASPRQHPTMTSPRYQSDTVFVGTCCIVIDMFYNHQLLNRDSRVVPHDRAGSLVLCT